MARAQGFARGDFDTSFPIDDKFLALRVAVEPTRYYAATGVYWHVVAAAWREVERKPATKVCPDAAAEIVDLQSVGLLDPDERLPNRAFLAYIGRAKRQRSKTSDRQRQHREGMSRVSHGSSRVTERDKQLVTRGHNPARVQGHVDTGEEGSGSVGGPGEGDDPEWPVLSYLASVNATIQPNGNGYHRELIALVERQGAVKVIAAMKVRHKAGDRSPRQLLYGAANDLEPITRPAPVKEKRGHEASAEEAERAFGG